LRRERVRTKLEPPRYLEAIMSTDRQTRDEPEDSRLPVDDLNAKPVDQAEADDVKGGADKGVTHAPLNFVHLIDAPTPKLYEGGN
jgi:hypothetical protein